MDMGDPYIRVDTVLMPWAVQHGLKIEKLYKGYDVRSIWVFDHLGNRCAQMWLELPTAEGIVTVRLAELDLASPRKWGRHEERKTTLATLEEALEELRVLAFDWAGPGAFT